MKKRREKPPSGILYSLTFIVPVTYSVVLQEMDNLQKLIFSGLALLVFLTAISKLKSYDEISLNKYLLFAIAVFPVSFFTAFLNNSATSLLLLLSNLLIPLCVIMLTVFMLLILGEEKFFKIVSISVVVISTLFGLIGLFEVFKVPIIPLPTVIPPGSTIGHRSFAVEYLLPSLPFLFILKEYVKKDLYPLLLISAFINVSFILFTRSRSAMLVLGVITALYFVYSIIKDKKSVKQLLPIAITLVVAFLFSNIPAEGAQRTNLRETAETMFDTEFRSNKLRITYWSASMQMLSENPITGVGLYKWNGYYPKYFNEEFTDQKVNFIQSIHAHNDFLELFAENGILAPTVYLLILFLLLKLLYSKIRIHAAYFYIFLSVIAYAMFSFVAFPLYKFSSHFMFSMVTGIALVNGKDQKLGIIKFKFAHLKLLLLASLIIGLATSILKLKSEIDFIDGVKLMSKKMFPEMIEELDKVSPIFYPYDPSKQPVDYYRGIGYSFLGDFSSALKYYNSALTLDPYNPVIMNNVATACHSLGKMKEAISQFEKLKELFPEYYSPQIKLAYLYTGDKQFNKGQELLNELLTKFPDRKELIDLREKFYNELRP